jgi:O-antigen/teichoic acid export membrane protein
VLRLPPDRLFDSSRLLAGVGRSSVRGGAISMAAQGVQLVLTFVGTAAMGRLLTPAAYGLVAMCMTTVGFVAMFKDAGLSTATIQAPEITREQVSTLFWINCAISTAVAGAVLLLAPLVAAFFHRPQLAALTACLSLTFLVSGIALQHNALLRRHMMFSTLALIQIASYAAYVATCIVAALRGAGPWSLVAGTLAQAAVTTALTLLFCPWLPGRPRRRAGVRKLVTFGGQLTGFDFLNYCARNLDNVLIGRLCGPGPLGAYTRAYSLLTLPLNQLNAPLSTVAVPALSRLAGAPEQYRRFYTRAVSMLGFLTIPGILFLVVTAGDVVPLLLGPGWDEAAVIYQLLGIAAVTQPVVSSTGWLYVSQGRSRDMFRWGLIGSAITVAAIAIGLAWGPRGVALSYSCFQWAALPLLCWFVFRAGPVRFRDVAGAVLPFLIAAAWACGAFWLARRYAPPALFPLPAGRLGPRGLLAAAGLVASLSLLALSAFAAGRDRLAQFRSVCRSLVTRTPAPAAPVPQ